MSPAEPVLVQLHGHGGSLASTDRIWARGQFGGQFVTDVFPGVYNCDELLIMSKSREPMTLGPVCLAVIIADPRALIHRHINVCASCCLSSAEAGYSLLRVYHTKKISGFFT